MNVYDFNVQNQQGKEISLKDFEGKVLLIVNTATGCGFTPQYDELQYLYQECHDNGLEILDFPCNQFGEQAPGSDEEIHSFCSGRYGISFPQYAKIEVNGENAIPLYKWLVENSHFDGFGLNPKGIAMSGVLKAIDKDYKTTDSIKWNFTKFLINRQGEIIDRFEPTVSMKTVIEKVKAAL